MEEKNYNQVIIDLCSKLDHVLEDKYGLSGTLMGKFKEFGATTWRGMDYEWKLIAKLIHCRNNLVHRNSSNETMSIRELST